LPHLGEKPPRPRRPAKLIKVRLVGEKGSLEATSQHIFGHLDATPIKVNIY